MRLARRHRIVLWDCFGNAIFSFIGCNKVAQETGSEFDPKKQSHSAIRDSNDPVSLKWPITSLVVLADFFLCFVKCMFWFLFCNVFVVVFFIKKVSLVLSFFIQKQRRSNSVVSGLADN